MKLQIKLLLHIVLVFRYKVLTTYSKHEQYNEKIAMIETMNSYPS